VQHEIGAYMQGDHLWAEPKRHFFAVYEHDTDCYVPCLVSCIHGESVLTLYSDINIPALKEMLKIFFIG
jgi:hypothetical protein